MAPQLMELVAEAGSTEAEKILATAKHAGVAVKLVQGRCDRTPCGLPVPELRLPGGAKIRHLGAILRRVAQCGAQCEGAPLTGNSYIEEGQVDSWLEWVYLEVDHSGDDLDVKQVLSVLEAQLKSQDYLVGDHFTLADLSAAISLQKPVERAGLSQLSSSFPRALKWLSASLAGGAAVTATATASGGAARRPSSPRRVRPAGEGAGGSAPPHPYTAGKITDKQPAAVYWAWFRKALGARLTAAAGASGVKGTADVQKAVLASATVDGLLSACESWGLPLSETEELHLKKAPISESWLRDVLKEASS